MRSTWITLIFVAAAAAAVAASLNRAPSPTPTLQAPAAALPPGLAALNPRAWTRGPAGVSLTGLSTAPVAGGPRAAAEAFLARHHTELGAATMEELELVRVEKTRLGAAVKYRQRAYGLVVLGGRLSLAVDPLGRVRRASSTVRPLAPPPAGSWIAPAEAVERAVQDFAGRRQLMLYPERGPRGLAAPAILDALGSARPVYLVRLRSIDPLSNWHVILDGHTGSVLHRRNVVARNGLAPNTAQVWRESPGALGTEPLTTVLLPDLAEPDSDSDGALDGNLIETLTCCRYKNCDAAARVKHTIVASVPILGQKNVAWCFEVQRASNSRDGRTNYVYPMGVEPSTQTGRTWEVAYNYDGSKYDPNMAEGESDILAEVNTYWHAREQYDYFRGIGDPDRVLDSLSDTGPLYVSSNFLVPDFQKAFKALQTFNVGAFDNALKTLIRVNNAAFVPRGEFLRQITDRGATVEDSVSERFDRDSIIHFQGEADFAWDGDVVRHEFGHAWIWSVADALVGEEVADEWGIFYPQGSMNEGYADYYATSALGEDPITANYVGPRTSGNAEVGIRVLDNPYSCPSVIEGEVHQDSQHFAGALWDIHVALGDGDTGLEHVIDEAIYDAMVSTSEPTYEAFGQATADAIGNALDSAARATALDKLGARGVIGCQRTIALMSDGASEGPKVVQHSGTMGKYSQYAPGPVQYHVSLPIGATKVEVSVVQDIPLQTCTPTSGAPAPDLAVVWKKGGPLAFTYAGSVSAAGSQTQLASDADGASIDCTASIMYGGKRTWAITLPASGGVACAPSTFHFAFGNYSEQPVGYEDVRAKVTVTPSVVNACSATPDAGPGPAQDAGPAADLDAGPGLDNGGGGSDVRDEGCNCGGGAGAAPVGILGVALGLLLARRRSGARVRSWSRAEPGWGFPRSEKRSNREGDREQATAAGRERRRVGDPPERAAAGAVGERLPMDAARSGSGNGNGNG